MHRCLHLCLGCVTTALLVAGLGRTVPAEGDGGPVGRWLTQDGDGVIGIEPCGQAILCGRIVGLTLDRPESPMPTDVRGRPLCGLPILEMRAGDGTWRGTITDPRSGSVWRAEMWLGGDGSLRLRGYVFGPGISWCGLVVNR